MIVPSPARISWSTPAPLPAGLQALARLGWRRGLARVAGWVGGPITVCCGRVPVELDLGVPYERHLFLGLSERDVLGVLEQCLRPGDVAVDVGAYVGFHTAFMANLVGPAGRVYALEPDPVVQVRLQRLAANNPLRNIEVAPVAASDTDAEAVLYQSVVSGLSSLRRAWSPETTVKEIRVRTQRLDAFLAERDCRHVRLLKIDVEGHEGSVLAGLQETLARGAVDIVVFEVTPPDHPAFDGRLGEILDALAHHGYVTVGLSAREPLPRARFEPDLRRLAPGYNLVALREPQP